MVLTTPQLTSKAARFVDTVRRTNPKIAVFDCDGTLWSGDSGADFFYWEIERGLVSREVADWALERYDDYKNDNVDELTICGDMTTMHHGISEEKLREAATEFVDAVVAQRAFVELKELVRILHEQRCEVWAVSSTNNWVVEAGVRHFGIPRERVLGACVEIENGIATDRLVRVPTDELKAKAIHEVIRRPVDAVFGNSMHDFDMLEIARDAYAINPNEDLEVEAQQRGWTIYWPTAIRG